jgi:fumarate reductase flavoprotein subunit
LSGYEAELMETGLADSDRAFNLTWHDWLNLESLIAVSRVIASAALARRDSRGAHFREDFPETGDLAATAFTRVRRTKDGLTVETVPVSFDIVRPGESLLESAIGASTAAE